LGTTGAPVRTLGPVDAEVREALIDGVTSVVLATFEIPDSGGVWAVVSLAHADGEQWMVGLTDPRNRRATGWQHDQFPSLHEAITAVCDPNMRARMGARTEQAQRLAELQRKASALTDALEDPLTDPDLTADDDGGCDV
jgi:hypothetical protein